LATLTNTTLTEIGINTLFFLVISAVAGGRYPYSFVGHRRVFVVEIAVSSLLRGNLLKVLMFLHIPSIVRTQFGILRRNGQPLESTIIGVRRFKDYSNTRV